MFTGAQDFISSYTDELKRLNSFFFLSVSSESSPLLFSHTIASFLCLYQQFYTCWTTCPKNNVEDTFQVTFLDVFFSITFWSLFRSLFLSVFTKLICFLKLLLTQQCHSLNLKVDRIRVVRICSKNEKRKR